MSHSKENLVLHLKLDEIIEDGNERKVRDALTGSKYKVQGNPEIVIDDKLGGCLSFDGEGDYVELIAADKLSLQNSSFTVEAWINIEDLRIHDRSILGNDEQLVNKSLHLIIRQKKPYLGFARNDTPGKTELAENNWYHITWRYNKNSQEQAIFVNGVLDNSSTNHMAFQGDGIVRIGRWLSGNYFKGKIAHVRIYNRALSPEEIKQDMDDDLKAIASFNKTHPLDFNLYEGEDKEPVIFIENGTNGQELTLEIVNNSDQPISLPPLSGEATATNYHFELRFRPDTLSPDSLQQLVLAEKEGWGMSSPVTQADGKVSLYFLATNNQALGANNTIPLTLQHINGAAAGGARTTRVELRCPQFTYHGETFNHYYREKRLSIISHRGKKHIPLHVGFVGSNHILNDESSTNELILQITNVLKDETIPFNPASKGDEASKLIISFDVDTDWALGTKSQVENIVIEGKDWRPNEKPEDDWSIDPGEEGETPTWTITHQNEEEAGLAPGQVVQLTISNIISSLPSGHANLYVRYENIPGYWDGTFVCTIEKSPILYKDHNVGIWTTTPQAKLSINGGLHVGGDSDPGDNNLLVDGTTTTDQLFVVGNVGIGTTTPQAKLSVNGRIKDKTGFVMPVATVVAYAGNKAPEGWLLCNGQQLTDLEKYGDLADALGERIPFNLPNYQQKFLVGADGRGEYQVGATGGLASVTLDVAEMPKHSHSGFTDGDGQHGHIEQETSRADNDDNDSVTQNICVPGTNYYKKNDGTISSKGSNHSHHFTTSENGGSKPHENRPPFVALNYIIKY